MTVEQADLIIEYLEAMNQILVKQLDYTMLLFFITSLVGGVFIGYKLGAK